MFQSQQSKGKIIGENDRFIVSKILSHSILQKALGWHTK